VVITVAIPTFARPGHALDALRSVAGEVCDVPFEVLVLDNACDSCLAESVGRLAKSASVPVAYIPVPAVGLHNARHEAARRAHGDVLAYLDDDVIVDRGWLAGVARSFRDPAVHLVGGRCLPLYEADPPPWLEAFCTRNDDGTWWCGWLTLVDLGPDAKDIDPLCVWGANFAIRKEALIKVGGFHPDGLPWHLRRFRGDGETAVSMAAQKLGLRAAYSPEATVHHRVSQERLTERYFARRSFLQGISASFAESRSLNGDEEPRARRGLGRRVVGRLKSVAAEQEERTRMPRDWQVRTARAGEAHAAGYAYHQEQFQRSPAVRAWVRRSDYWAGTVPDLDNGSPAIGDDAHKPRPRAAS
jgi:glycosyltransferase involved in cell wall biosynthesis